MAHWRAAVGVGVAAVLLAAGPAGPAAAQKAKAKAESFPVNERVVEFARKKLGEQVGNGECWTLANNALLAAGGKSSPAYKDFPAMGDYVWGVPVLAVAAKDGQPVEEKLPTKWKVAPGDVVQFRDAKFAGARPGGGTYALTAPQYTAVVDAVGPDGLTLGVLHQNWAGTRTVRQETFRLRDLKEGWVKVYRPLPR